VADDAPSLDAILGALETDELLRLNDWLQDVSEMPGWQRLMELLDAEAMRAQRVAAHVERWQPRGMDGLIKHQAAEGHTVGFLKGLGEIRTVVDRVERLAADVARALDQS
jgi:hypothetical protein